MDTLKDYILANLGMPKITIPFDLHETITIPDIAYLALGNIEFTLEDKYDEYVSSDDGNSSCQECNYLILLQPIANRENVCLLHAVAYPDCHNSYYHYIREDPENPGIFSKEYIEECKNYAISNGLENSPFGELLLGFGVSFPHNGNDFQAKYLSQVNVKSARNV